MELGQGIADGLAADLARGNALGIGNFGDGVEGPDAGLFAEGARALVQQRALLVAPGGVKDGVGSALGRRRAGSEDSKAIGVEAMNDIADGLVVTAKALSNQAGMVAACAGEQDLAAAEHKGVGRAEAGVDHLLFGRGEGSDIDWWSHGGRVPHFLPPCLRLH